MCRTKTTRLSHRRLLRFESLESRRVLASVVVSNLSDELNGDQDLGITALNLIPGPDGISLREAVIAANETFGPDTITFDWNAIGAARDITLSDLGEIEITDPVTIDAGSGRPDLFSNPDNKITITAYDPTPMQPGDEERIFYIDTLSGRFSSVLSTVELNDLRLTGGGAFPASNGLESIGGAILAAYDADAVPDPVEEPAAPRGGRTSSARA